MSSFVQFSNLGFLFSVYSMVNQVMTIRNVTVHNEVLKFTVKSLEMVRVSSV